MGGLKKSGVSGLTCRFTTSYKKPERYATMNKDNVISFENRELFEDSFTDLIGNGARQLIALAVEAEVNEFMVKYDGQHAEIGRQVGSSKRLPAAAPDSDGHRCGDGEDSQGALDQRSAGGVSLLADSAVCAKDAHAGGVCGMAVSERHQQRRDGRGAWSTAGAERQTFTHLR